MRKGIGSTPFDSEGVATQERHSLIQDGVLASYLLSSYSARKLGMQTTANAGGSQMSSYNPAPKAYPIY